MPADKVNVTKLLGAGAIGQIDPASGMVVNLGTVVAVGGYGTVTVEEGTGGILQQRYASDLFVTYAHATGVWSFPSGDGSIVYGHALDFPGGVPEGSGTNAVYTKGLEPVTFDPWD